MDRYEASSQVWREHCEKVRQLEKARREASRGKVKIGAHYVPPMYEIKGCWEAYEGRHNPSLVVKIATGTLIASAFILLGWVL